MQYQDAARILGILQDLMAGENHRTRIDFRSAVPLTVLALRARYDTTALQALEADRGPRCNGSTISPRSEERAIPWARYLRRLAALVEVYARVLG